MDGFQTHSICIGIRLSIIPIRGNSEKSATFLNPETICPSVHNHFTLQVSSNFEQWTWYSEFVDHRQHHPNGQKEIHDLIESHLPLPKNPNSTESFPSMLYMAQIMQSMGQKTQTEFYRRNVDKFYEAENGTGYNMGALYWQLNDIWEGCSWSSFGNKVTKIYVT